jgi:LmbE family N-acetylglucosaminyl deacetylase
MKIKLFLPLTGLVVILLISFLFLLKIKRSEIFEYDVSRDYHYNFKNADVVDLKLIEGKIVLPADLGMNKTAFLKVKVKSTLLGNFFTPQIEINSKYQKVIDYFEYGGSGYRYLNISSLLKEDRNEVELKCEFLEILESDVELISFSNSIKPESKILFISPHPDDAEIAAFGLYSEFPNSFVLTITAGDGGPMVYDELFSDSIRQSLKKGQIRTINSVTVPLMAGLNYHNILNLGYFDGTIREMHDKNPTSILSPILQTDFVGTFRNFNISYLKDSLTGTSNWNSLVQNLQFVLKTYQPDIIVLPHPQMDSHSDHQFSTIATLQALKNADIRKGELFLYSNHHVKTEFFPFGKTGGTISLPPNFDNDYYFHSVYSHHLTEEEQMEKVLALDAMNDLRLDTEWRFWDKLLKLSYENFKASLKGQENSYFKRAIRSNELFFVVPINELYVESNFDELQFGKNLYPKY